MWYIYLLNIGRHPFFKYRCKSSKGSLFYLRILYTQNGTIMTSENCRDNRKPTPFWRPYEWSINNHIIIVQYCLCVVVFLLPCLHDVIPRSPHRYSATVRYLAITSILWCLGTWIIIIHPQRLFSLLAKLTHSTYRNRVPQCISPLVEIESLSVTPTPSLASECVPPLLPLALETCVFSVIFSYSYRLPNLSCSFFHRKMQSKWGQGHKSTLHCLIRLTLAVSNLFSKYKILSYMICYIVPYPHPEWTLSPLRADFGEWRNGEMEKIRENSTYPHPEWIS